MNGPVAYIPIATTFVAVLFTVELVSRWRARGGTHLLWWAVGTCTYGLGTITESLTTLVGWHEPIFRAWYLTGALLGGAPLAQGTVYLLLPRRTADRLTVALVLAIAVAAGAVLASPIHADLVEPHRLSGRVLAWQWARLFSPFINLYAAAFLIGGAVLSAWRYAAARATRYRAAGNALIAVGALLPGIGGTFTRFGHTEVLYVTEFIGLLLIAAGYHTITQRSSGEPDVPASPVPPVP